MTEVRTRDIYLPGAVMPPCEHVKEALDERGVGDWWLAQQLGVSAEFVDAFMGNRVRLDRHLAEGLAAVFKVSVMRWLELEKDWCNWLKDADVLESVDKGKRFAPIEILIYEDRRGGHVVITKIAGRQVRTTVRAEERLDLGTAEDFATVAEHLELLEAAEDDLP